MFKSSRLFFYFILILIAGCSGLQTAYDYRLNKNEGLVFFSVTQSGELQSSFKLVFESLENQQKIVTHLRLSETPEIGDLPAANTDRYSSYDNPVGKLVVFRLPEGVYQLSQWETSNQALLADKYSLAKNLDRKFRVSSGNLLYLGNIHQISSKDQTRVLIRDQRIRDIKLFSKHYPLVETKDLKVASKLFLNPAEDRHRIFDAYTSCGFDDGPELISKRRLPSDSQPFRTLKIENQELKISRIDGYRLKYAYPDQQVFISIKVELSEARDYRQDRLYVNQWLDYIDKTVENFELQSVTVDYFNEQVLNTGVLEENRMVQMRLLFDDASQMMTHITFINPPEYIRSYKTLEQFLPEGERVIAQYKACVLEKLNGFK